MAIDDQRLIEAELQFGGMFRGERVKHSPHDKLRVGGDRGCDRMEYQNYAPIYAAALKTLTREPKRIVEMGIFAGTGLAMWSVLFPEADIIGLDVDIDRYKKHLPILKEQGAFQAREPRVFEFDELDAGSWDLLYCIIEQGSVDLWIDDAIHRTDVILEAEKKARGFMAPRSVYLIEDNSTVPEIMWNRYTGRNDYDILIGGEDDRVVALCKLP